MAENTSKMGLISKILFLVGILFLIFLFAFALIKFVPKIFSGFASIGQLIKSPFSAKTVSIQSDKTFINSGDTFTLNWDYSNENNQGYYAISYDCQNDLDIKIKDSGQIKNLLCNTVYNLNNNKKTELLGFLNKANSFTDIPIKIEYIDRENKSVLASGQIKISIQNELAETEDEGEIKITSEPITNTTPKITTSTSGNTNKIIYSGINYSYTGLADLVITNVFASNNLTIVFTISNNGGQATGPWYFDYVTPDNKTNSSPMQPTLLPGQGMRFTLTLENSPSGNFIILVDPKNNIVEKDYLNNIGSTKITGNGKKSNDNSYNKNDDADLKIIEIQSGRLSGNRFIRESTIDEGDEAAVRFVVKNNGGKSTGTWRFEINDIPYNNNQTYNSGRQNTLAPGQTREIIVGFDNAREGRYNIRVTVDSNDDVDEENERNNTENVSLRVR